MQFGPNPNITLFNPAQYAGRIGEGPSPSPAMSSSTPSSSAYSAQHREMWRYEPVASYAEDYRNDQPLLQELGVDFGHMYTKVMAVLNPARRVDEDIMVDSDMAGPIVFLVVLGFCLLLAGKIHFGYIYGFGAFGNVAMYTIMNLMAHAGHSLDMARTFSVLGYALLPIVGLAVVAVFVSLRNVVGAVLGLLCITWCTACATKFFEAALTMKAQRWLIAYPVFLFYACFVLITIF